jgi:hypothetical protein
MLIETEFATEIQPEFRGTAKSLGTWDFGASRSEPEDFENAEASEDPKNFEGPADNRESELE